MDLRGSPVCSVILLTIINLVGVPAQRIARVERAVETQSVQVARYWHTPDLKFGLNGWPVYIALPARVRAICGEGTDGCHGLPPGVTVPPAVWVSSGALSVALSHEVVEELEDPVGGRPEIADPVEGCYYPLNGVWVSDFTLPGRHRDFMKSRSCFS